MWKAFTVLTTQSRNVFINSSDLVDEDIQGTCGTLWSLGTEEERVKKREMGCLTVSMKLNIGYKTVSIVLSK